MNKQTLRSEIRELILKNKTDDAFELLSSVQFSETDKQLIILNSQYNRVKQELRLNVIPRDEAEIKINQINIALLDISNEVDLAPIQQLSWKPKGSKGGVVGGREAGKNLIVCRSNHNGSQHPGKVVVGMCHIGWGGEEICLEDFEILTNSGTALEKWTAILNKQLPAGSVIAGYENGRTLYVGRALKDGVYHPGKVFLAEGDYSCNFGYGGKEIIEKVNFEILVSDL